MLMVEMCATGPRRNRLHGQRHQRPLQFPPLPAPPHPPPRPQPRQQHPTVASNLNPEPHGPDPHAEQLRRAGRSRRSEQVSETHASVAAGEPGYTARGMRPMAFSGLRWGIGRRE